jgi:hypothetical protein
MRKLVDYKIVCGSHVEEVEKSIRDYIGDGWELLGPAYCCQDRHCQTIVKYEMPLKCERLHQNLPPKMRRNYEIRDNREASAHARIECARDILDRALGKAVQRVETAGVVTSEDPVAEVARRESEVKRLREEGDSL